MSIIKTDVLVIGSGIAGLTTAIKVAEKRPELKIMVLTKTVKEESNTRYAQGGIASVWNMKEDSFQKHIADTLDAGDGLCDKEVVEMVISEGPERVREIIEWGTRFDVNKSNTYDLGREGGHSENRVLHYKDLTGWEIQRALLEKAKKLPNIELLENHFAVEFITQHHLGKTITRLTPDIKCFGAYVLDKKTKKTETVIARMTVAATGGTGQIYKATTNPVIATGDGIAMMYRAKGHVENMEFVQFHPTSLYDPTGKSPSFLISEAVRGFGAVLKTKDGEEFMHKYDKRLSLAPRDIVARAIDKEMKNRGEDYMCLDCTHLDKDAFTAHFPTIYDKCMEVGIDPMKDFIPIVPACHYMCGGIKVDKKGKSSIDNLYAAGECTSTGLHGANRLASNSLLEALVYAHHIAIDIDETIDDVPFHEAIPEWNAESMIEPEELVLITQSHKELKDVMSSYVGIVRSNVRLKRANDRLWLLYTETNDLYNTSTLSLELCELRNLITIGYLVTKSASMRQESRGLHFTLDYPEKSDFIDPSII